MAGRPSYGAREAFTVRVPDEHGRCYRNLATAAKPDDRGINISDYLAVALADAHGQDPPPWIKPDVANRVLALLAQARAEAAQARKQEAKRAKRKRTGRNHHPVKEVFSRSA
ncbi:hypothetical protein [Longimycelium tulufanense]|nr:hypothetical protein [Longimycelium tulufanense]